MTWNELVSTVREKLARGLGRRGGEEIQLATHATSLEQLGDRPLAAPAVDVYENDKELLLHADVPGGTRDGATVAWDEARGLTLMVKGHGLPSGSRWLSEYQPRDWYRSFPLPEYADGSRASSTIKDGVLTIRIPKRTAASRLIPVKAG